MTIFQFFGSQSVLPQTQSNQLSWGYLAGTPDGTSITAAGDWVLSPWMGFSPIARDTVPPADTKWTVIAPRSGTVQSIAVSVGEAGAAAATNVTIEIFKNGVAIGAGLSVTFAANAAAGIQKAALGAPVAVADADVLECRLTVAADVTDANMPKTVHVAVDFL